MQSLTLRTIETNFGICRNHPIMEVTDLIAWYEKLGYKYRHMSIRAGYLPKMLPGNNIAANYSGRFGRGIQIIEGLSASRVKVHYLIEEAPCSTN